MTAPTLPIHRRPGLYRLLLAALAVAILWLSLGGYLRWRQRFDELSEVAEIHGIAARRPGLVVGMRRDASPTRAALRLARAILADELDQRWILDLPPEEREAERQRGLERLDVAYELGVESLGERPGSWEALLVVGGAEYLRLARRQQTRRLLEREIWLAPLEEAHRLAPLQPEPLRFLAAADLGNWSVLSDEEKQRAIVRLESAFLDANTFDLLSPAWFRVAPSLRQALDIVPDRIWAWSGLTKYFARRGDWERYCDARRKSLDAMRSFAVSRLDEADDRLRWGDQDKGIQQLLWVASNTPPDSSNEQLIERVLATLPPGVGGEASDRWLGSWLDWSLERCTQAGSCPLSERALLRLTSLSRELPPAKKAWALAAAGSLRDAEAVERSFRKENEGPLDLDWSPYVILKARLLAAEPGAQEALALLRQVPPLGRNSVSYWRAYRAVAEAAGSDLDAAEADSWLQTQERTLWSRSDWLIDRRTARLDLWPAHAGQGITLTLNVSGGDSGILELVWDGSLVEILPAVDGRVVDLAVPVTRDSHTLEIRAVEGAPTATAGVRLLPLGP